jgi:hypothetical protein
MRRSLDFRDFKEVRADIKMLQAKGYERQGKWSLGQNCEHLEQWMRYPLDGYPKPPFPMGFALWVMRTTLGPRIVRDIIKTRKIPGGRGTLPVTVPVETVDDKQAVEKLEQTMDRFEKHSGPMKPSLIFGRLDREQYVQLQLVHCSHHLGFLVPKG